MDKNDSLLWFKSIAQTKNSAPYDNEVSYLFSSDNRCFFLIPFDDSIIVDGQSYYSKGKQDLIIGALNFDGQILWHFQIGGPEDDLIGKNAICFDENNEAYFLSTISYGSIKIDTIHIGLNATLLTNKSSGLLLKIDSNGIVKNMRQIDFYSGGEVVGNITYAKNKLYYTLADLNFTSYNFNGINFGIPLVQGSSGALVKANLNGDPDWIKTFGGDKYTKVGTLAIRVDSRDKINLLISGYNIGHYYFSNNAAITQIGNHNSYCLVQYDTSGNILWKKTSSNNNNTYPSDITTNQDGDVLLNGSFSGTLNFTNDTLKIANYQSNIFLVCYDSLGNAKWAKQGGGMHLENSKDIEVDMDGNLYLIGLSKSFNFEMDDLNELLPGSNNLFIVKLGKIGVDTKDITPSKNVFRLYPNPVMNMINLNVNVNSDMSTKKPWSLTIYNYMGLLQYQSTHLFSIPKQIDVSNLSKGLYYLLIQNEDIKETIAFEK